MSYLWAAVWALTTLACLCVLTVGRPAVEAQQTAIIAEKDQRIAAQSTENTYLRATIYARPTTTPTPRRPF